MSQINALYSLLDDGLPHRTDQILKEVYGSEHLGLARIGARIYDLKKKGYLIRSYPDKEIKSLTWYQLINEKTDNQETEKETRSDIQSVHQTTGQGQMLHLF